MAIKIKSPKNINWGRATYLEVGIKTKVNAMKLARKYYNKNLNRFKNIAVIPEISYGEIRPFGYTIIAEN